MFNCELCPTTCGRKTDLRIHVQKLHTADKPLKCKRCGNLFPDRYSYKLHSKTHEGEKCYKCELCPYASISARHLESHMLIHTDQKPFNCDLCEQSFRWALPWMKFQMFSVPQPTILLQTKTIAEAPRKSLPQSRLRSTETQGKESQMPEQSVHSIVPAQGQFD